MARSIRFLPEVQADVQRLTGQGKSTSQIESYLKDVYGRAYRRQDIQSDMRTFVNKPKKAAARKNVPKKYLYPFAPDSKLPKMKKGMHFQTKRYSYEVEIFFIETENYSEIYEEVVALRKLGLTKEEISNILEENYPDLEFEIKKTARRIVSQKKLTFKELYGKLLEEWENELNQGAERYKDGLGVLLEVKVLNIYKRVIK